MMNPSLMISCLRQWSQHLSDRHDGFLKHWMSPDWIGGRPSDPAAAAWFELYQRKRGPATDQCSTDLLDTQLRWRQRLELNYWSHLLPRDTLESRGEPDRKQSLLNK